MRLPTPLDIRACDHELSEKQNELLESLRSSMVTGLGPGAGGIRSSLRDQTRPARAGGGRGLAESGIRSDRVYPGGSPGPCHGPVTQAAEAKLETQHCQGGMKWP
eukprot:456435-Hanusia_phi.AAC.1